MNTLTQIVDGILLEQETTIYYHATTSDRVENIARNGLVPSEEPRWGGGLGDYSLGKIFLAEKPTKALFYAGIIFREMLETYGLAYLPILLRVALPEPLSKDPFDPDSAITETIIPPQYIETWWHEWMPIERLARIIGDGEDMVYQYEDKVGEIVDWEGSPVGTTAKDALQDVRKFYF